MFLLSCICSDLPKLLGDLAGRLSTQEPKELWGAFGAFSFISYIHIVCMQLSFFLHQMVFQMSGNLFTRRKSQRSPEKTLDDRKKAEMQKGFGRTVDHCDKSMTERMTEIL